MARIVRPIKVDAPWDIVGIDILGLFHQAFYSFSDCILSLRCDTCCPLPHVHQDRSQRHNKETPV